jgi:hypothetical protein
MLGAAAAAASYALLSSPARSTGTVAATLCLDSIILLNAVATSSLRAQIAARDEALVKIHNIVERALARLRGESAARPEERDD